MTNIGQQIVDRLRLGVVNSSSHVWPVYGDPNARLLRYDYMTASEAGKCIRELRLTKDQERASDQDVNDDNKGVTKYDSTTDWGFFERGHNVESWVVEKLMIGLSLEPLDDGVELLHTGEDQVSFVANKQAGTPDGVLINRLKGTVAAIDFKSITPTINRSRLPKKGHVEQIVQNTDLLAHNYDLDPDTGYLIYVNCSDYSLIDYIEVPFDEDMAQRLYVKSEQLFSTPPEQLEPEGMLKRGCTFCPPIARTQCSRMVADAKRKGKSDDNATSIEEIRAAARSVFDR